MAKQINSLGAAGEEMIVIAETMTDNRHEEFLNIEGEVVLPKLRSEREKEDEKMARNVLICLPPSKANGRIGSYDEELSQVNHININYRSMKEPQRLYLSMLYLLIA